MLQHMNLNRQPHFELPEQQSIFAPMSLKNDHVENWTPFFARSEDCHLPMAMAGFYPIDRDHLKV